VNEESLETLHGDGDRQLWCGGAEVMMSDGSLLRRLTLGTQDRKCQMIGSTGGDV